MSNEITIHKNLHDQEMTLCLHPGKQAHWVLIDPVNVRLEVQQLADTAFTLHIISLSGEDSRCHITITHDAHGCETRLFGLALLREQQHYHIETHVLHNVGGGYSDQLFKNVLLNQAQGSFYGELKVMPEAQKTEAHQTNRNILLSPLARMHTMPQLEIYADDVKCSHGATTGQLDPQALFYMQQRGISLDSARRLLLLAFLSDCLQMLSEEMIGDIENRLHQLL